ncbi:hypothetical protein Prudu_021676 [Prunus dulcis]|uniref:Uncharacterized protein n=1 Tax=Prunus dulcis TaxID=3755 RepID=A0A4Y1RXW8_PRUDU|nr:hypothetical protein Prudu_021676 [Prunus dulcis]
MVCSFVLDHCLLKRKREMSEDGNLPPADCNGLNFFFNISGTLKGLANKFGLAVVVTNQVVDFIGPHDKVNGVRLGNLESLDTSGRRVSPVLGLAWAHCINSRVFLADMSNLLRSTFVMLLQQAYVVKHKGHFTLYLPTSGLCIGRICNQKRRYSRSIK